MQGAGDWFVNAALVTGPRQECEIRELNILHGKDSRLTPFKHKRNLIKCHNSYYQLFKLI